ncbi:MAG: ABC transporter ATP-binding protein [Acidimicrobiia bacterium]|nr:ABC transporter ATP-binding protein [Acidimicrobiia bacterium]
MLQVRGATSVLGGVMVLDHVDLDVPTNSVAALLGASGSGKSTLLRTIAGLQPRAHVTWNGRVLDEVPVHERPFGLMFQDHALFPHLDVGANVAFGLRMHHHPDPASRVAEVLELVDLAGFQRRDPATLSGGESQRVALARALAPGPELLMLDEPLGALDRELKDRLLDELGALLRELATTAIYVTHDHDEARTVADSVTILENGCVLQSGPIRTVWDHPASSAVARFLGYEAEAEIAVQDGIWTTPWGTMRGWGIEDGTHTIVIPPHAVEFSRAGQLAGSAESHRYVGGRAELRVSGNGSSLTGPSDGAPPPRGTRLNFDIHPGSVLRF